MMAARTNLRPVLATGLSGLIGTKVAKVLAKKYHFENLDVNHLDRPVDITDPEAVTAAITESPSPVVIHLAAYTDVTGAWKQSDDTAGLAYQVNVDGTKHVVAACQQAGKHLIHVSTAYVFNGQKSHSYTEHDQPQPIEWYGRTKWLAEQAVTAADTPWTILRIDQPFRSDPFTKLDIAHRIIKGLHQDSLHPLFTNHFFGPTFVDDLALILDWVIESGTTGLFHASSGEKWSDYDFGVLIKNTLKLPGEVKPGDLDEYLQTLDRPYQRNTSLDTTKLQQAAQLELHSVREAVELLRP